MVTFWVQADYRLNMEAAVAKLVWEDPYYIIKLRV